MLSSVLDNTIKNIDILDLTHSLLLKQNVQIVCLIFSTGEKIYVNKKELCAIKYFKLMMEENECIHNENIIVEIQLIGIVDNYKIFDKILYFIKNGFISSYPDIFLLHNLLIMDDYLLGITKLNGYKLKEHITGILLDCIPNNFINNNKELYDTIYQICVICNVNPNTIYISSRNINYNSGFIDSLLYENLNEYHKNAIKKNLVDKI
jgi:hypothetical protein